MMASSENANGKMEFHDITVGYGNHAILQHFTASIQSGRILCLLGPNGVGKTTLFKSVLGLLPLISGDVLIDGEDALAMDRPVFARKVAYVPQAHRPPFAFYVRDVVVVGRISHMSAVASKPDKHDYRIVDEVLEGLGISHLADRVYTELSGGERQMVLVARALAQKPRFLFMDEPTSSLDFGNQVEIIETVTRLAYNEGIGVVMTTHNPNHLLMCDADGALILPGSRYLFGRGRDILTDENLYEAYSVHVDVRDIDASDGYDAVCCPIIGNREDLRKVHP